MSNKPIYVAPEAIGIWTSSCPICASVGAGIDGVPENTGIWDEESF